MSAPMGVEGVPVSADGSFSVDEAQLTSTPATSGVHDVTVIAVDPSGGVSTHVTSMTWDKSTGTLTPVPMSDPNDGAATFDEETGEITRVEEAAQAPAAGVARGSAADPRTWVIRG